ncbi:hypothetical protein HKCCE2091_09425 [Rhodobacterales bacterium HKCCE2091]|nr:hypothetical protein [Rhodobacterales bacterium HKCCE2091]
MIAILTAAILAIALTVLAGTVPDLAWLPAAALAAWLVLAFLVLRRRGRSRPADAPRPVVVDGSNVMHWDDGTPDLAPVRAVVERLTAAGYAPGVMFDANAGYLLRGRYLRDRDFAGLLGLPRDRVMVVPKGTQADSYILTAARDMGAVIVTNDRFRDWAEQFPEVRDRGHLIRGGFRDGALRLALPGDPPLAGSGPGR